MVTLSTRLRLAALVAFGTGVLVAACGRDSTGGGNGPKFLVVSPDPVGLIRFDSVQLSVSVLDKDSALISGVSVSFQSTDTAIAKVSNLGMVHSTGPRGATTIGVTAATLHRNVPVTVTSTPTTIVVAPLDTTVKQGATYQLRTAVLDAFGDSLANAPRSFQSADTSVAVITTSGLVTTRNSGHTSFLVSSGILANPGAAVTVTDSNVVATIPLANAPYGVAASGTGVVYVTPIIGPAVRRVNMSNFTLTDAITIGGDPAQVAFAGAGATALVTQRAAGLVSIIDVATHSRLDTIKIPGSPYPVRVSANGATAYVTSTIGWLYKLDIASRTRIDSVAAPDPALQLALGPGDSLLYFSSQSAGTVTEVRTATMAVVRTFTPGGTPQGVAVSQDGAELYIADEAGPLRIWSLSGGTQIDSIATGGSTFGIALTPDGTQLYVGTTAGRIFKVDRVSRAILYQANVGGTPRNIAVDPVTGYAIIPNEASNLIDIMK